MFKWILKKIKEKNEGFTLVEILVVIAILGGFDSCSRTKIKQI